GIMAKKDNINMLIYAITNKQGNFQLYRSTTAFEKLLSQALEQEPRLLFFISSYSVQINKNSAFSLTSDFDVTMTYNEEGPDSLDQIMIDDGQYTLLNYTSLAYPDKLYFITDDPQDLTNRIHNTYVDISTKYEGIYGLATQYYSFEKISEKKCFTVTFNYCMPIPQLNQKLRQAEFKANNIVKDLSQGLNLLPFIKVYLAFTYLQQNTFYDNRCYNNLAADVESCKIDPAPHISYGPLAENRGICSGLAYAFKKLMESFNIECIVVNGELDEGDAMLHAWNIVKLNNQYYHVDATCGIEQGVCFQSFMKCDSQMKRYRWNQNIVPAATGRHYSYDFIEDWLIDHGEDLVDAGIDSRYVFPDFIE
ncbi:MAG: hypothetical protein LUG46_03155, partial [Erysipelotrichaceae bacterium]|nr:hypothetical protein [Erysipelotrichaceae bacterium]